MSRTGMDWVSQWMDECKCWRPKHCNSKNGMNAWEKPLRRGIWMEKEKGGWMRFARSEISAEFWRIGPRCHDSPIRSIPIFKHFAPDIGRGCGIRNLWNQKSLDFPDGSNLKTFWYQVNINVYPFLKSIHTLTFPFLYLHWTAFRLDPTESWCFTMPSEKALTLPWNGLGGFLLRLLSAKLIMIKIRRLGESYQ